MLHKPRGGEDMDRKLIESAVTAIEAQGKRVSVRSVHALTGGSFRDVQRHLKALVAEGVVVVTEVNNLVTEEDGMTIATTAADLQATHPAATDDHDPVAQAMAQLEQARTAMEALEQEL